MKTITINENRQTHIKRYEIRENKTNTLKYNQRTEKYEQL